MVYNPSQKKKSDFITDDAVTNASTFDYVKAGVNKKTTWSNLISLFQNQFGLGMRVYETESAMVADSLLQLGDYAIVEENYYAVYKITNIAAAAGDVTLASGLIASQEGKASNNDWASYADARALKSSAFKDGEILNLTNDGISSQFVVKSGTVTDDAFENIVFTDNPNRYIERRGDSARIRTRYIGDDWAAIQSALNSVTENGKIIKLPAGTITGSTTLSWPTIYSVILEGVGSTASGDGATQVSGTKLQYTGTGNAIQVHGDAWNATQCGGGIKDIHLLSSTGAAGTAVAVSLRWVSGSTGRWFMQEVFADQFNVGYRLDAVLDSRFTNMNARGCGTGWYMIGQNEAVNGNDFFSCAADSSVTGIYMQDGVNHNRWFGGVYQGNITGVHIRGETFGPKVNKFFGTYFESAQAASKGVLIDKAGGSTDPDNNGFYGCLSTSWAIGFDLQACKNTVISGSQLLDYYDRVLVGQIPIRVAAGSTGAVLDLNVNESGNNPYSLAGVGTYYRDIDASGNLRTFVSGSSGSNQAYSAASAQSYLNLNTGTSYADINTSTANPRIDLANGMDLIVYSDNYSTEASRVSADGYVKTTPVAVSALPAAGTAGSGARMTVNDANATTFNSVVAGGGANIVPVYSDGTNWRIG